MNVQPFSANAGGTVQIPVTTSSASVTLNASQINFNVFRIYNSGSAVAFIRVSIGASTAVGTTDIPIPPGVIEIFSKGFSDTISAITLSGTTILYITVGEGQ